MAELFKRVGMEKELLLFEQEEVDFQSLMMMSEDHLKDLGTRVQCESVCYLCALKPYFFPFCANDSNQP